MQATQLNSTAVVFPINVLRTFTPNSNFAVTTFEYKGNTFARHVYSDTYDGTTHHIEVIVRMEGDAPTHLHTIMIDKTDRFPVNFPLSRAIKELPQRVKIMREMDEAMRYTQMVEIE